jgi:MFS-type transporter involved in bile tolerance (Atg22 family)
MAVAIYSVYFKVAAMLGPIIFGLLTAFGSSQAASIIGIATIILIIAFAFYQRTTAASIAEPLEDPPEVQ